MKPLLKGQVRGIQIRTGISHDFGNAENRKIVENVLEMSTDESGTALVDPYRRPRHPTTFYDNQSTS